MNGQIDKKTNELIDYIKMLDSVVIAFSGGVDSTFLAYVTNSALGDKAVAITINTPYTPNWEIEEAKELAKDIGIKHKIINLKVPVEIEDNPPNRCYLCKKVIFNTLINEASNLGVKYVIDGSNYDDTSDYRPGLIALKELEIKSPLLEYGWTKEMIRTASKEIGLKTHDKPAFACLLTRIEYNYQISVEILERIERSEVYLMSKGLNGIRVRVHDELARIEVDKNERYKLFDEILLDEISSTFKDYGFSYVTIDVKGYEMGSFNKQINK